MKLIISTAFGLIFTLLFFGNSTMTFAQCGNGPSCTGNFVCVNSDGAARCLQNQVSSNGLCQGDASVRCSASQACIQNNATEIVCAPLAVSSANPSLPISPDATTCSPACTSGETCVKSAQGPLVCRDTATDCSPACTQGKVCVKPTPTSTAGLCVDSAPTPTTGGDSGGAGGAGGSGGSGGGGLLEGLNAFGGAGSGLNTTGTLIGFIANIIRWILGLLGMVFFVIVVLQGYLYMVSSGDASKTAAATGAITNAVIGLIIIMGAFLITNYVTSALTSGVSSETSNTTNSSGSTNGASGSSPTQPSNTISPGTVLPSPSSNN